jgi:ribosomal protein S18 acetylase RimI-like enzyme
MNIRRATAADLDVLRDLWEEFEREVPEPPHRARPLDELWVDAIEMLDRHLALLAERDGRALGYAFAKLEPPRIVFLDELYVRPNERRRGTARALMAEVVAWAAEQGIRHMTLEVLTSNQDARAMYERLGFAEESRNLVVGLDSLAARLQPREHRPSFGSIHVQTDDADAVVRAVRQYVPRLPGGSRGSVVAAPRNGWTAVYDELCDREPAMLRRLALELGDRMGAVVLAIGIEDGAVVRYVLFERGSVVDEYASVPEFGGPLPPGDVIALGANPTVLARLTGADPSMVREIARTAATPDELPSAQELLAAVARLLGLEGAEHGYAAAGDLPGATNLDRSA